MLNYIWPVFLMLSILYAFISGNIEKVNSGIFESSKSAVELCINLLGTISLWNGIMHIAYRSNLINKCVKVLNPVINKLFPDLKNDTNVKKEISMNIIANVLGLGNAATPLGIKAMNSMQEKNNKKDVISNSMMMFIVINTASLQLIPTTIIAIRTSFNSSNPTSIVFPVWCASVCSIIVAVLATKVLIKKTEYKKDEQKKSNNR